MHAVLANFPRGTPLLVVAPASSEFGRIAADLGDPAVEVATLEGGGEIDHAGLAAAPHVLLEGLDAVERPAALLAALHERAPRARLFALVSNAAHVRGLAAFFGGRPLAANHPFVQAELEPLFAAAGWRTLAVTPIPDRSIEPPAELPGYLELANMSLRVEDAAMRDAGCTAAYLVVADRA